MTLSAPPSPGRDQFAFSAFVFLRLLAVVHVIAFVSAWVQLAGLIGPHGIAPAGAYFDAAHQQLGRAAFRELPSLCWWFGTGKFLSVLCAIGVAAGVLLFAGVAPPLCLFVLWFGYISLCTVGQQFWAFQWDGLLVETTLLAVFVAPWQWLPGWRAVEPPRIARWLVWWLLFRLMFFAGVVKLSSGDPTWRNFTALTFHYETQPLPTPFAWYAQQMPVWWHKFECGVMFVIELGIPWLIFAPRRLRHVAGLTLAAFMTAIAATGNYTFFNALAIVLCLFCLDDALWHRALRIGARAKSPLGTPARDTGAHAPAAVFEPAAPRDDPSPLQSSSRRLLRADRSVRHAAAIAFGVFAFAYTGVESLSVLLPQIGAPPGFAWVDRWIGPLRTFNNYGLFAVMTHPRPELMVEGSDDGREWREYEFPAKPGDLAKRPTFVAPYQPRLDWQLWFAALDSPENNPWVLALCEHLLRGTPEVLALLGKNPFPDRPPRYIRVVRYEYHFTDYASRARTGDWWHRTPLDLYVSPVSLRQ